MIPQTTLLTEQELHRFIVSRSSGMLLVHEQTTLLTDAHLSRALLAQALAALMAKEWEPELTQGGGLVLPRWYCAECRAYRSEGHTDTCTIGNAIAAMHAAGVKAEAV